MYNMINDERIFQSFGKDLHGQSSCHLYMAFRLLQNMASGHVKVKKGTGHVLYMATLSHATESVVLFYINLHCISVLAARCPPVQLVEFTELVFYNNTEGGHAEYRCQPGKRFETGLDSDIIYCENGKWNREIGPCKGWFSSSVFIIP